MSLLGTVILAVVCLALGYGVGVANTIDGYFKRTDPIDYAKFQKRMKIGRG